MCIRDVARANVDPAEGFQLLGLQPNVTDIHLPSALLKLERFQAG